MNRREFIASTATMAVGSQLGFGHYVVEPGAWSAYVELDGQHYELSGEIDSEGNMTVTNSTGEYIPAGTPVYLQKR